MAQHKRPGRELTAVSAAFLENSLNLKKFLTRLVSNQRDIEDVVQETYLRAFVSEQRKTVAQPQAFLFRVARNIALTALTRKSRQITDYIEDLASTDVLGAEASADAQLEAEQPRHLLRGDRDAAREMPGSVPAPEGARIVP